MWPFERRPPPIVRRRYPDPPPKVGAPEILASAPGPSPWHLAGKTVPSPAGVLHWRSGDDPASGAGKTLLVAPGGEVLAVADFYCYVRPLGDRRLLAWYAEEEGEGDALRRRMRFRVLDVEGLRPIPDPAAVAARLGKHECFAVAAGEVATVAIPTDLPAGEHAVAVPPEMAAAGELLVLARAPVAKGVDLRLWIIDTVQGQLTVVPQDWFNEGDYDFGYQGVTRVARMPGTGQIVGDGIRIAPFRLGSDLRHIV